MRHRPRLRAAMSGRRVGGRPKNTPPSAATTREANSAQETGSIVACMALLGACDARPARVGSGNYSCQRPACQCVAPTEVPHSMPLSAASRRRRRRTSALAAACGRYLQRRSVRRAAQGRSDRVPASRRDPAVLRDRGRVHCRARQLQRRWQKPRCFATEADCAAAGGECSHSGPFTSCRTEQG